MSTPSSTVQTPKYEYSQRMADQNAAYKATYGRVAPACVTQLEGLDAVVQHMPQRRKDEIYSRFNAAFEKGVKDPNKSLDPNRNLDPTKGLSLFFKDYFTLFNQKVLEVTVDVIVSNQFQKLFISGVSGQELSQQAIAKFSNFSAEGKAAIQQVLRAGAGRNRDVDVAKTDPQDLALAVAKVFHGMDPDYVPPAPSSSSSSSSNSSPNSSNSSASVLNPRNPYPSSLPSSSSSASTVLSSAFPSYPSIQPYPSSSSSSSSSSGSSVSSSRFTEDLGDAQKKKLKEETLRKHGLNPSGGTVTPTTTPGSNTGNFTGAGGGGFAHHVAGTGAPLAFASGGVNSSNITYNFPDT